MNWLSKLMIVSNVFAFILWFISGELHESIAIIFVISMFILWHRSEKKQEQEEKEDLINTIKIAIKKEV